MPRTEHTESTEKSSQAERVVFDSEASGRAKPVRHMRRTGDRE